MGVGSGLKEATGDMTSGGVAIGPGAGAGGEMLDVLVAVGAAAGAGVGTAEGGGPEVMVPFSRLTSLPGTFLPEKNSPAVSAGSAEGAGG